MTAKIFARSAITTLQMYAKIFSKPSTLFLIIQRLRVSASVLHHYQTFLVELVEEYAGVSEYCCLWVKLVVLIIIGK